MKKVLFLLMLLTVPVLAFAQEPQVGGGILGMLNDRLSVGMAISYDWVRGEWDQPFSIGPVGAWKINDRLLIRGAAKYVPNAETWRSEVQLTVPLFGGNYQGGRP